MGEKYTTRGVENNLNEVLTLLADHLGIDAEAYSIDIGIWDNTPSTTTYYAVLVDQANVIQAGENSYGSVSLAEAVGELLKDMHEYIDSLEDDDE